MLLVLSNLAISESKFDQLEKEVEILKQELLQARQAGMYPCTCFAPLCWFASYV